MWAIYEEKYWAADNFLTRLQDFIEQHLSKDKIMFLFDLAFCHYASEIQNWQREQNMSFVL